MKPNSPLSGEGVQILCISSSQVLLCFLFVLVVAHGKIPEPLCHPGPCQTARCASLKLPAAEPVDKKCQIYIEEFAGMSEDMSLPETYVKKCKQVCQKICPKTFQTRAERHARRHVRIDKTTCQNTISSRKYLKETVMTVIVRVCRVRPNNI